MALIDQTLPGTAPDLARPEQARPIPRAVPHAALARLSMLHSEAGDDLSLLRFLARAPQACLLLMAAGASLLVWEHLRASNAPLESEFVWVLSVLTGIAAMTGLHIRSYAQGAARMPLHKAAAALRQLLFYTGVAWGSGALLVMPASPVLAIGFAAGPSLALSLLLGDPKGATAFTAPVTLATASAACLVWPSGLWVAATVLATGLLSFCLPMLQREIFPRRDFLPARRTL